MWYLLWAVGILLACNLGIVNALRIDAAENNSADAK
ncbi:cytochrome bd-I oxidase subunit CydX [Shewanella sp. NFH-SH190041]|nr:cytochrome bd-I oxidase subunit CydX [Shewanella sp. NFH-SH190041]